MNRPQSDYRQPYLTFAHPSQPIFRVLTILLAGEARPTVFENTERYRS